MRCRMSGKLGKIANHLGPFRHHRHFLAKCLCCFSPNFKHNCRFRQKEMDAKGVACSADRVADTHHVPDWPPARDNFIPRSNGRRGDGMLIRVN